MNEVLIGFVVVWLWLTWVHNKIRDQDRRLKEIEKRLKDPEDYDDYDDYEDD